MSFVGHGYRTAKSSDPTLTKTDAATVTVPKVGNQITFTVAGGQANTVYSVETGDVGGIKTLTTDGSGAGSVAYTYPTNGTYRATVRNTKTNAVAYDANVTLP
jgi:hypothetical protein